MHVLLTYLLIYLLLVPDVVPTIMSLSSVFRYECMTVGRDSRVVSLSDFNARGPEFESRWRIVKFSDRICKYLPRNEWTAPLVKLCVCCFGLYHRLNGSSSPVLTATCLSYGSLCDFLGFFPNRPGGHTPRPILTQNGSNDVDSRNMCLLE